MSPQAVCDKSQIRHIVLIKCVTISDLLNTCVCGTMQILVYSVSGPVGSNAGPSG